MSLTTVATNTRKTIRYGFYTILALIALRILLGIAINVYRAVFPKPPPPPTVAFGKLPKLSFPAQNNLPKFEYNLETVGDLPAFADQGKVYFMPKTNVTLLSFDEAKAKASKLGFKTEPEKVSDTILRFRNTDTPSTLEINIVSEVFSMSYNLAADSTPLQKQPPSVQEASQKVKQFLQANGLMTEDLSAGKVVPQFFNTEKERLVPVISLSEAKLIKINIFRQDYDKLPTVTLNPKEANVWFIIGGTGDILAGEYHYYPVDITQVATYPLKNSKEALDNLVQGSAYIANLGGNADGKVTIRKIYIAYFDPGGSTDQFMQPVAVFEGDRDFIAYVPLIENDFYGE